MNRKTGPCPGARTIAGAEHTMARTTAGAEPTMAQSSATEAHLRDAIEATMRLETEVKSGKRRSKPSADQAGEEVGQ